MSFAEEAAVAAEVVSAGRGLGFHPDYDNLPLEQQVRLVEEAWESPLPRLLVFDNCENPVLLDRWRPRHGGSRVLVTSRRSQWDRALGVQTLTLGILKRPESIQLLRGFRDDLAAADDPALDEIAEELGDLPLALHLAGSFLARYQHAPFGQPAVYLKELRPLPLKRRMAQHWHPETARSLNNLGYVLTMLGNYGKAFNCLNRALEIREKILGIDHPDTAESLNNIGFLLSHQEDDSAARVYYERALAIREKVLGAEHPDTALSLNNLGSLLDSEGDYSGARGYYERALAILNARLGPDHPRTKIVRDNLDSLANK